MKYTYSYPMPSVTVDAVVFGIGQGRDGSPELQVLLIKRADEPFKGCVALPGGFVNVKEDPANPADQGEDLEVAVRRELDEETGIKVEYMEQLCTVGTPGRDPRGRVITVAYFALVRTVDHVAKAGSDAKEAAWYPVKSVPFSPRSGYAFDHLTILRTAHERLCSKVRYAPIGFNLLPPTFTLTQLQELYEAILMRKLDSGSFRRRLRLMNKRGPILVEAGRQKDVPHRAAALYRFDKRAYDKAVRDGFNFEI